MTAPHARVITVSDGVAAGSREDRSGDALAGILSAAGDRPWLRVVVIDARLIADIADGYDAVVMGADKWAQVVDPAWYGDDPTERDRALARLPRVAVAPRHGHPIAEHPLPGGPVAHELVLPVPDACA